MTNLVTRLDEAYKSDHHAIGDLWNLCDEAADRIRELESINTELVEALLEARHEIEILPRSMAYDITTLPVIDAALAKARGEEPPR